MYTKYRGHTHSCHQLKNQRGCLLPFTKCCLVVGGMCVRSIMAIRTTVNKATMVVVGDMGVRSITAVHYCQQSYVS